MAGCVTDIQIVLSIIQKYSNLLKKFYLNVDILTTCFLNKICKELRYGWLLDPGSVTAGRISLQQTGYRSYDNVLTTIYFVYLQNKKKLLQCHFLRSKLSSWQISSRSNKWKAS